MKKYSSNKELRRLIRDKVREGWVYWRGAKHGRLRHPKSKRTVTVPCTPSDRRSLDNLRHQLARADIE